MGRRTSKAGGRWKNSARKVMQERYSKPSQISQRNQAAGKHGNILTGSNKIAQRWAEYCSELYNFGAEVNRTILHEDGETKCEGEERESEILRSEVEIAMKGLKNNKSPKSLTVVS
eukprot:gene16553-18231_t